MKKLLILIYLMFHIITVKSQDYNITEHGVSIDSTVINTSSIQRVIDKAHVNGGGTIVIPKGVYLTGALFFKPKTRLRLLEGAVLKGSDNIKDYPVLPSRMEGQNLDYYVALINAYQVDNFKITGPGTINGNGLRFWKTFWAHRDSLRKINKESTNLEVYRPRLLFIWGCDNVTIQNIKLRNSGFWTTHLYQCTNVLMDNCDIRSPYRPIPAPSTDGIDIDVCKNVTIRNCYISVNDDAIAIKGGKGSNAQQLPGNGIIEDILIENCTFGSAHATVTIGSESIHARNIAIKNCKVDNNCPILNFKMRPDTYQIFENITVDNITGKCGSIINIKPWTQFFNLRDSNQKPYGIVRNITMSNIIVQSQSFGHIEGNPVDQISKIRFKDVNVTAEIPALKNKYEDIKTENVMVNGAPLAVD